MASEADEVLWVMQADHVLWVMQADHVLHSNFAKRLATAL